MLWQHGKRGLRTRILVCPHLWSMYVQSSNNSNHNHTYICAFAFAYSCILNHLSFLLQPQPLFFAEYTGNSFNASNGISIHDDSLDSNCDLNFPGPFVKWQVIYLTAVRPSLVVFNNCSLVVTPLDPIIALRSFATTILPVSPLVIPGPVERLTRPIH